jgi:hypothetical protein
MKVKCHRAQIVSRWKLQDASMEFQIEDDHEIRFAVTTRRIG